MGINYYQKEEVFVFTLIQVHFYYNSVCFRDRHYFVNYIIRVQWPDKSAPTTRSQNLGHPLKVYTFDSY